MNNKIKFFYFLTGLLFLNLFSSIKEVTQEIKSLLSQEIYTYLHKKALDHFTKEALKKKLPYSLSTKMPSPIFKKETTLDVWKVILNMVFKIKLIQISELSKNNSNAEQQNRLLKILKEPIQLFQEFMVGLTPQNCNQAILELMEDAKKNNNFDMALIIVHGVLKNYCYRLKKAHRFLPTHMILSKLVIETAKILKTINHDRYKSKFDDILLDIFNEYFNYSVPGKVRFYNAQHIESIVNELKNKVNQKSIFDLKKLNPLQRFMDWYNKKRERHEEF